jgi:hypothetical protein
VALQIGRSERVGSELISATEVSPTYAESGLRAKAEMSATAQKMT